jgi:hypothetical protein
MVVGRKNVIFLEGFQASPTRLSDEKELESEEG